MKKQIAPVVIAVITNNDHKFLLTKRIHLDPEDIEEISLYHNAWQLPGGGVEFGETPKQALHREIKEELNIEVKIIDFAPIVYTQIRKNWQGIFLVYLCLMKDEKQKIILNDEASEYSWFNIDEAAKLKTLPCTIEVMKDASKLFLKSAAERI